MVMILSFQLGIVRADITAGIAHAAPLNNGIIERPLSPNPRSNLSVMKLTLDIYPVSSSMAMNANRKAI